MRVVTWNCNGAFRKKFSSISELKADIYVIQECEDPERVTKPSKDYESFSMGHLWTGENKNKGLGIFVRNGISIERIELNHTWNEMNLRWFLPFLVGKKQQMLGVWSHRGDSDEYRYIGQFWCFLQKNKERLRDTVIVGDFNSNTIWDYKRIECTHSNCVKELHEIEIESPYHAIEGIAQGKEEAHTFFLQNNENKKYHIDYFFCPKDLLSATTEFTIGDFTEWKELSDHVPLVWEYTEKE